VINQVTKIFTVAATTAALTLALGACGSSTKSPSTSSTSTGSTITIHNFAFGPPITVKMGATVTVKNTDTTAHTVTADDMSFDTGPIQPGKAATITVSKAGTVKFHCDIHNYMTGSIQVTA
jgi:plastocyanin